MQVWIRKLTGNHYVLPLVIFLICIWRIFTPQLTSHYGLGWDGTRYYLLTVYGLQSDQLDAYTVLRIFPSLFIHTIMAVFGIAFNPYNVIVVFKLMNASLIGIAALMVKKIFELYDLSPVAQITGLVIVFLNYGVLNFTFYYPVMTDTPAFFLSVALFYFFTRGELLNVLLVGLIGAFTWPVLFLMAVALILFPNKQIKFIKPALNWTLSLGLVSVVYVIAMGWYLIFVRGENADFKFAMPISHHMLPVTFVCMGALFFFIPQVLRNRTFLSLAYYREEIKPYRILSVLLLTAAFIIIRLQIKTPPSEYLTLYHQIKIHLLYAFQRPLITIVSHFNYYGCAILLVIIFWRRFSAFISTFGLGVAGCVFVNLFVFFVKPESRAIIHFFPWMLILLSLYLGQFRFNNLFYALIFLLNLLFAKLWLYFEYSDYVNGLLPDGTVDFPDQWFYMHLGIWMTEQVWLWLCIAFFISLLLFIFSLYKIEPTQKALVFYKKFEPVKV